MRTTCRYYYILIWATKDAKGKVIKRAILEESSEGEFSELDIWRPLIASKRVITIRRLKLKLDRILYRPNIYTGLYIVSITREYDNTININILAGEGKHKYVVSYSYIVANIYRVFKRLADNISPPNLIGYQFAKEVL